MPINDLPKRNAPNRYTPAVMILVIVMLYVFASVRLVSHFGSEQHQSLKFEHLSLDSFQHTTEPMQPEQIESLFNLKGFKPLEDEVVALGFQKPTQVFRAQFNLPANQMHTLFMHTYIEAPVLDVHFRFQDGHIETQSFGTQQPFWQRAIPATNVAAPFIQSQAQPVEILVVLKTFASIAFVATVAPSESYVQRYQTEQAIGWLMIGGLIMMGLYNLFLSFLVRSNVHFYYSLYVFSLAAMQVVLSGLGFKYLWPEGAPFLGPAASPITVACVGITATLFARTFLDAAKLTPWADKAVLTIPVFALLTVALIAFLPMIVVIELALVLAAYFMLMITILVLIQLRKGNPNARMFALAWMFFVGGGSLTAGVYQGVVPANFLTFNGSNIGGLIEAIVLALALANQLNILRREKITAQEQTRLALQQRNEALEESNQIKDRFLATISHELRTPLNSMIGSFDLLRRDIPNVSIQRDLIENGLISGEHLNSLVDKLLEFTEIESGQYQVGESTIDLSFWFDSLKSRYELHAQQKQLELRCETSLPHTPVLIDGDLLTKITVQLLDNAIRFTDKGFVVFQAHVNDRQQLLLHIADSGQGIPDEKKHWLAQNFCQLDQSEQRQHGGLGVGLALTQAWVALLNGKFELSDSAAGGVAINIELPIKQIATENQAAEVPAKLLQHRRVLIVEDSPVNQKVMCAILNRMDFKCVIANHGKAALKALSLDANFDFIIMDCEMPVMDGYQTTEAIRQEPASYRDIPIFAVTANAMSTDRARCIAAGMDDYLAKPVRVDGVTELIQRWFENNE